MHKYSGVILDFYDDQGATLKAKFPTADELPDTIKTASVQARGDLSNEDFALVAVDGGEVLRKFACNDAGTTAMSVIYFMEHGDKLPEGAQKLAAANLLESCLEHGLLPPMALTKTAGAREWAAKNLPTFTRGARAAREAAGAPFRGIGRNIVRGAKEEASKIDRAKVNKVVSDAAEAATKGTSKGLTSPKMREAAQTIGKDLGIGGSDGSKLKNMAILSLVAGGAGGAGVAGGRYMTQRAQKAGQRVLDITGEKPETKVKKASAENYMFEGRFPIDSWEQIKLAEAYLSENAPVMDPSVLRECSVKLASRAADVSYPLDGDLLERGAMWYADDGHLRASLEMRKIACADDDGFLAELFEKRASFGPEVYSECLRRFDIQNGLDEVWNQQVPDPWSSTFGLSKMAEVVWEEGADRVTDDELQNLATNGKELLMKTFTDSMVTEFCKDPVSIFKSMPAPEKKTMARLAADVSSDGGSKGMPKEAKLRVGDIEDRLGIYLPDEHEAKARQMIAYKNQRSFALRHPWLTGVPTLGIAPAIAKSRAAGSIATRMARESPEIRAATSKARAEKRQQAMERYKLETERAKAEQAQRVAGAMGSALVRSMALRNQDRQNERTQQQQMVAGQ